jgi:hemolysin III
VSALDLRPMLRGHFHVVASLLSIPAGVLLVVNAERATARVAAAVYASTLLLAFGVSAVYHRFARGRRLRAVMQRLDHSTIYLLIAGTYTPVCLIALPPAWGIPVLAVVATGAATGVVLKLAAFSGVGRYASILYPVLGWVALVASPMLVSVLDPLELVLFVLGGVAYTVGMPVLLLRRPNPWPRVFGYHEIWHAFTVLAAVLHFGAVTSLLA